MIYFCCGIGLTFPLGIFPEILNGQQRIALVNTIFSISFIVNFVCLALAIHFHWGITVIMIFGLLSGIIPSGICAMYGFSHMPKVRIHPKFFSVAMIRETTQFSFFAYLITVSNILLSKTDQLVISSVLTVAAIAIYQAGAKISEMFGTFAQQLPSIFSPTAAHLHAKGDKVFLRALLINGTRLSVMLATPGYLICAFYMEPLLRLLTGAKSANTETFWIGEVLVFWGYTTVMTQSVTKRVFMMCGHERRLTWLTIAEAVLNLGLSIGLILHFRNVLCVALGSLISTLLIGWTFLWPWAAREAQMSGWQLMRAVLVPIWRSEEHTSELQSL
jgi:O-antigen/teichoic acid export membrane protein